MEPLQNITEDDLNRLRKRVSGVLGEKRLAHTKGVEEEIARLGELFLPDRIPALRAAALLHDITKELPYEKQIEILKARSREVTDADRRSPAVFHAKTAALIIPEEYPEFNLPEIISAISKHTIGSPDMTTFDKLLYTADYIEPGRTWENCKQLRRIFWESIGSLPESRYPAILNSVILRSLEMTMQDLLEDRRPIVPETVLTYNAFLVL